MIKLKEKKAVLYTLVLLAVLISPAAAQTISIASQTVSPGATVTVPIVAINITNLAAFTITLSYNPAVVWVDSVTSGALGGVIASINNATGSTRMSAFSIFGKSGNITLANVVLKAAGTAGQTSPLDINVAEIVDSNGIAIPVTVHNGTFTIQTASSTVAPNRTNVSITSPIASTPVEFTVGNIAVSGAIKYPKLESVLSQLISANNSQEFAQAHNLYIQNGSVRVVVELMNETDMLPDYVVEETRYKNKVQILVPIEKIASLSLETNVIFIRAPLKPYADTSIATDIPTATTQTTTPKSGFNSAVPFILSIALIILIGKIRK